MWAKMAAVLAAVWVFSASAAPAGEPAEPAEPGDPIPLDRLRILDAYPPKVTLRQGPDGVVWQNRGRQIGHTGNARRLDARQRLCPLVDARAFQPPKEKVYLGELVAIDTGDRRWFLKDGSESGIRIQCVDGNGVLTQETFPEKHARYFEDFAPAIPAGPPFFGNEMLIDESGSVWCADVSRLHRWSRGEWEGFVLPDPTTNRPKDAGFFHKHTGQAHNTDRLFRDGDVVWLIRSAYANVRQAGSFLVRFDERHGTLGVAARTCDEYLTAVLRHGDRRLLLVASGSDDKHPIQTSPTHILQSNAAGESWKRGKLAGYEAARLVFVCADGRQCVRPWADGRPAPELLVLDGEGELQRVPLEAQGLRLQHQTGEGDIYGRDERGVVRLDKAGRLELVVPAGAVEASSLTVTAVRDGRICLTCPVDYGAGSSTMSFWVDPAVPSPLRAIRGEAIAEGLPEVPLRTIVFPVVRGPEGALWFVRHECVGVEDGNRVRTQLWRARDGEAEQLTSWVATASDPSIWVLGPDAAIVVGDSDDGKGQGCFLWDGKTVGRHGTLGELVEAEEGKLLELMEDGAIYCAGAYYDRLWLGRLGDGFVVAETCYKTFDTGCRLLNRCGIRRKGEWTERAEEQLGRKGRNLPFNRPVGADPETGRLLAYTDGCTKLQWLPIASDAEPAEELVSLSVAFAWQWFDGSEQPRMDGAWILADEVARNWEKTRAKHEEEAREAGVEPYSHPYSSDDFPAFRRWHDGQWQQLKRSVYGSQSCDGPAGDVWMLRVGEAEVVFPDGHSQLIETDAMIGWWSRLEAESDDAVWLTTQCSLTRYQLLRDAEGAPTGWRPTHRFGLQSVGFEFKGPWISGDDFYYVSDGSVYHTTLEKLLADE